MALHEKLVLRDVQERILPEVKAALREIMETDVIWIVDWDSFSSETTAVDNLEYEVFEPLLQATRSVCRNSPARALLQESLKRIEIRNTPGLNDRKLELMEGTLTIHAWWGGDQTTDYPSGGMLSKVLERAL